MKRWFVVGAVLAFVCGSSAPALGQTNVVTNGSFESGLTGWTTSTQLESGASGNCGYNATTSAGSEPVSGQTAFPPTDGTQLALGGVASTSGAGSHIISCVLYQDVAIPAGATTATLTFDLGAKGGVDGGFNTAARIGIYSAASVPSFASLPVVGTLVPTPSYSAAAPDAVLHAQTSGSFNISARAGQTVRIAIINGAMHSGGEMLGVDNVRLLVNAAAPPPAQVPTLSQWSLIGLSLLLCVIGFVVLRRHRLA